MTDQVQEIEEEDYLSAPSRPQAQDEKGGDSEEDDRGGLAGDTDDNESDGGDDNSDDESENDDEMGTERRRKKRSEKGDEEKAALTLQSTMLGAEQNEPDYTVLINDSSFLEAEDADFPNNIIITSKYTIVTFIPLNLFEQFRRVANIYFALIIGIQCIPNVSPFSIYTSIIPLSFILCVGAIKDGIEDFHRHEDDNRANAIPVLKLNPQQNDFTVTHSSKLQVGDVIMIKRGEEIPADCIVLSTNNKDGSCYISTSSLDGENAPKPRRAVKNTAHIDSAQDLLALRGSIQCRKNTKSLHGFFGNVHLEKRSVVPEKKTKARIGMDDRRASQDQDTGDYLFAQTDDTNQVSHTDDYFVCSLGDEHFLFRGAKVVNTEYAMAIVLYVGPQTKLMLNRNQVPFKFSKFEKIMNQCILCILGFNFVLCVAFGLAANLVNIPFAELQRSDWTESFFLDTATWLILTSWMIPFSLYVTMELIKMVQSQWVTWDDALLYWYGTGPETSSKPNRVVSDSALDEDDQEPMGEKRRAKVKNSNLNEELGHVDYIFTDKTGTLTQNQMELCRLSIVGRKFQNDVRSSESSSPSADVQMSEDFSPLSEIVRDIFANESKQDASQLTQEDQREIHFFWNLLLCGATLPVARHKVLTYMDLPEDFVSGESLDVHHATGYGSTQARGTSLEEEKKQSVTSHVAGKSFVEEEIEYMSPSPDEVAFAEALADHGIVLEERRADSTMSIRLHPNKTHVRKKGKSDGSLSRNFKLLACLDFTAKRKRMTVLVEDDQQNIFLYTKGADSTVFNMCADADKALLQRTKRHVTSFAKGGSRTLVIAYKPVSKAQFEDFDREYRKAEIALTRRDDRIEKAFASLEHSMFLLGCTAVEDQMQEGVPEAIQKLKEAHIQVIMLTGDKEETAVSIGRQSGIVGESIPDSELMMVSARAPENPKDLDALEKQMLKVEKKMKTFIKKCKKRADEFQSTMAENADADEFAPPETVTRAHKESIGFGRFGGRIVSDAFEAALVINGDALEMALHPALVETFVELFHFCTTIVCNRANPAQKAMVVSMAKRRLDGVALAIGDGANDVSMIQASSVGVGIMGKEGTQAALASDFVIHRFRHLTRLIFVHGRFSFLRSSCVALLSLYKNMAFNLPVAYFACVSQFTGQTNFDAQMMSAFNIFFTALFPLAVGAFEQDISDETAMHHPKAYYYFKMDTMFNLKYFGFWMWSALWQSMVFFVISYLVLWENLDMWDDTGKNGGIWVWGTQMLTATVIVISVKMMAETMQWNWLYYATTGLGILLYFCTLAVVENLLSYDPDMWQVMDWTFKSGLSWLLILITVTVTLLPGLLYNLYNREHNAHLSIVLYEAEKFGYLTLNGEHRPTKDIVEDYMKR